MRSFAIACLLMAIFAISKADFTNTASAKLDDFHNGIVTVVCNSNSTEAYVAGWLGPNQKVITGAQIAGKVNKTNPFFAENGVLYGGNFSDTNATTFTLNVSVSLLQNTGETYDLVAYCNSSTPTPAGANFSSGASTSWVQTNNNGTDYYLDVTYNNSVYNSSGTNLTALETAQTEVLLALVLTPELVASQVVTASSNVAGDKLVVRTYILRNYALANDNTWATIENNITKAVNLNDTLTKDLNAKKLAGGDVSVLTTVGGFVAQPSAVVAVPTTNDVSLTITVNSNIDAAWSLVGVIASQYITPQYLSNINVFAGTFDNGTAFPLKQNGNIKANTVGSVPFSGLAPNTSYSFYLVLQDTTTPSHPLSQLISIPATTKPSFVPANVTNYTASASATVGADNLVTIVVNCSYESTAAAYYAQIGNHAVTATKVSIQTCSQNGFNAKPDNTLVCDSQKTNGESYTFTLNATYQRNLGSKYTFAAFCWNATGNSTTATGTWTNKDNGGQTIKVNVTYNGTFDATNLTINQSEAFASLLPTVNSSLIQSQTVATASFARSLAVTANATNTTINTYVLRNFAVSNDTTYKLVEALNNNQTAGNLSAYFKNHSVTQLLDVLNVGFASLPNPAATLAYTSNSPQTVTLQLGSNVDGSYVVGGFPVNVYNNSDNLDPSDVFNHMNENAVLFNYTTTGKITAGASLSVVLKNLTANTKANFYAVVQDSVGQLSPIVKLSASSANAGNFGEKLVGFGFVLVLAMIAVLFN